MRYRKLTADGDMTFGGGQKDFYVDNAQAVGQLVLTRLKLMKGEWFIDVDEGTPYQQAILGANKRLTLEPAIRERIIRTENVKTLDSLTWSIDASRRVTVSALITTAFGQTQINEVL